jgi:hypothetical protein
MIVAIYVNDILVFSHEHTKIDSLATELSKSFEIRSLGQYRCRVFVYFQGRELLWRDELLLAGGLLGDLLQVVEQPPRPVQYRVEKITLRREVPGALLNSNT